jgi:hypothetical protein
MKKILAVFFTFLVALPLSANARDTLLYGGVESSTLDAGNTDLDSAIFLGVANESTLYELALRDGQSLDESVFRIERLIPLRYGWPTRNTFMAVEGALHDQEYSLASGAVTTDFSFGYGLGLVQYIGDRSGVSVRLMGRMTPVSSFNDSNTQTGTERRFSVDLGVIVPVF